MVLVAASSSRRVTYPSGTMAAVESRRVIMFLVPGYCRVDIDFDGLYQMVSPLPRVISDGFALESRGSLGYRTFARSKSHLPLKYNIFRR